MILKSIPKGAEFTYGVHGPSLAELVPDNAATIMGKEEAGSVLVALDSIVMGSVRSLNDKHQLLRQGIAYGLPFTRNEDGEIVFLVYCREKKNNEQQLAMKLSLAPGGHIDRPDLTYHVLDTGNVYLEETAIIDYPLTNRRNLARELHEEVKFSFLETPKGVGMHSFVQAELAQGEINKAASSNAIPCGFVMDSKPGEVYVGNVHFGALFLVPVPEKVTFEMAESVNNAVGWHTAAELREALTGDRLLYKEGAVFEPWSQLVIEKLNEVEGVIKDNWDAFRK